MPGIVVAVPDWIWYVFVFVFGCCVGSFLNVVIYRLPRDKSLIRPPSFCPSCGRRIRFYDNIPLLSWLLLRGRCRYCREPISPRYFVIELLTGLVFLGLFYLYFYSNWRSGIVAFPKGGWLIYLASLVLAGGLIAASAIDLEFWVIPISICYYVTGVGLLASSIAGYIIEPAAIRHHNLLPSASAGTGALAVGAALGVAVSLLMLVTGLIKRSYESSATEQQQQVQDEAGVNHRLEICREIVFLLPVLACSLGAYLLLQKNQTLHNWWIDLLERPFVSGLLGSLWGYFVGCAVVWTTRILGTLGFGKEAMGLGDVHLMGAAGSIIGPVPVVTAFFVAPFFGLAWAAVQMLFKKTHQIPYGPFLSLGIFTVIIFHDRIWEYWILIRYH